LHRARSKALIDGVPTREDFGPKRSDECDAGNDDKPGDKSVLNDLTAALILADFTEKIFESFCAHCLLSFLKRRLRLATGGGV